METFLTVISGVLVFVICQLFIEYFLKPVQDYKKLKSKIAYVLVYYACYYCNPGADNENEHSKWIEASDELRKIAAETMAFAQIKPKHNCYIPDEKVLTTVQGLLMRLSNSCNNTGKALENYKDKKEIYKLLDIERENANEK